jgi:gamma-glutamylcyclotransferase (GGCT)/AIG2-like uncharacterized protein YtfP
MVVRTTTKKGGAHKKDPDYGKIRVFVYGTLKMHKANNLVLRKSGAKFLGYDTITVPAAAFIDLGGFPALIWPIDGATASSQIIRGEIWYGEKEMLTSCDILEGHPLFYERKKHWSDIHRRRVWAYALKEEWISEGEDFLNEPWWQPHKIEQDFWKKFNKDGKISKNTSDTDEVIIV